MFCKLWTIKEVKSTFMRFYRKELDLEEELVKIIKIIEMLAPHSSSKNVSATTNKKKNESTKGCFT